MIRSSRSNCKTAKSTTTKIETTRRTATETTPSSNHTSTPDHLSNSGNKSLLENEQKDIDYLIKKVRYLEGKITVTQWDNSLLEAKSDCQEQYSRCPCLVIRKMNEPGDDESDLDKFTETLARESNINKDVVIKNIDKTHTIGKIDEKGLQCRIVKFTSDSFKKKYLKNTRKTKKTTEDQKKNNNQSMLK